MRPTMTEITQDPPEDDEFLWINPDHPDDLGFERYADVRLEDGQVLLYDLEETDAWIQSDVTVPIEDVT